MSFAPILRAVESHLAAHWTETPIAWENVDFTPPDGNWIKPTLVTEQNEQIGIGGGGLIRSRGKIQVQCHVPTGKGAQTALALADKAIATLRTLELDGLVLRPARAVPDEEGDRIETHFRVLAEIPFWRDTVG